MSRARPVVLAHVSDVHFGAHDPALVADLQERLTELAPDLVVVSGDLTQRARRSQFRAARTWLDGLPAPFLVIPGNHDVPLYDLPRRILSPLGRFHGMITGVRAPLEAVKGVRVLGLDSTRRKVTGWLRPERLRSLPRLGEGWPGDLRVLAVHHPLTKRQTRNLDAALQAIVAADVDVILSGHTHLSGRRLVDRDPGLGLLLVNAGTTTSTRRRDTDPTNAFNVLRWDAAAQELRVELWRAPARPPFRLERTLTYRRDGAGWRPIGSAEPTTRLTRQSTR